MDQWRDIPGYEGLYQVSSSGIVMRGNRIKKQRQDHRGYMTIWLSKDSKQKNYKVHRLVAQAFIPNPDGKRTVNHIDGNKQNNKVDNLEWATHSENINHANATGLRTVTEAQRRAARLNGLKTCDQNRQHKAVICRASSQEVEFESAHAGARFCNGSASAIVKCCKGKARTHKGYRWRYA